MSNLVLEAQPRDPNANKARHLRNQGLIPVVVYGKTQVPVPLVVEERAFETTLHHGGSSRLVKVNVSDGGTFDVLVRDIQRDPVVHNLLHADFYAVRMDEKQHVGVPVIGVGVPNAMASGLMVLQNLELLLIEALPADIPSAIEVDVTNLTTEEPIRISGLPVVKGVTYLADPDDHVFALVATRAGVEDLEEEAAEAAEGEPEVITKGKQEEEE